MNTMRVFLHDLLWQQAAAGFKKLIDAFLRIAARHKIKPSSSCSIHAGPHSQLGAQRAPKPGVQNSGWMQSPGADALQERAQFLRLETYVKGVVSAFANDKRILVWDVNDSAGHVRLNSATGYITPKDMLAGPQH